MANNIPKIVYGTGPTTISFDYPPAGDPLGEKLVNKGTTVLSGDGSVQHSQQYIERIYTVKLQFVVKADVDAFRTFLTTWGLAKKPFDYYQHSDGSATATVTLVDDSVKIERVLPGASSDFLYDLEWSMREVL